MVLFLANSAFAYKRSVVTLYGDKSGSATIQTDDVDALTNGLMALGFGSSASVNATIKFSFANFQNKGLLMKGWYNLIIQGSGSLTKSSIPANASGKMIFNGGPVFYGTNSIVFHNLTYNLNANSNNSNCASGSLVANGSTISCAQLNQMLKNSGMLFLMYSIM